MSGLFTFRSNVTASPFYFDVARGYYPNMSLVHKFGINESVSTSAVPISRSGFYRTPTVATTLRIKAGGNANDTAAGTGAQEVTLEGLDANFNQITETLVTNGASASAVTSNTFTRLTSAYVSKSGTYATQSAGSHAGAITIEKGTGSEDWAVIGFTGFPRGRAQIGAYTVPAGKSAYLLSIEADIEATKIVNILFFTRENIGDVVTPYSGVMRLKEEYVGAQGQISDFYITPQKIPEKTDLGFLAYTSGATASVSVSFEILLVDN